LQFQRAATSASAAGRGETAALLSEDGSSQLVVVQPAMALLASHTASHCLTPCPCVFCSAGELHDAAALAGFSPGDAITMLSVLQKLERLIDAIDLPTGTRVRQLPLHLLTDHPRALAARSTRRLLVVVLLLQARSPASRASRRDPQSLA